ncbi:2-hydroxymuconate tautomerase [Alicyclobacillus sp. ALC3]|uniref:2-hydroxymuconate tautomerase n=1 Tax=Alicyclobacillus sp. ALC3 TaxID=2796143 RepID=UPI0027A0577B|nr:2-hydroxymuconate tautomerase family protein [Alicyclobacillus sp. ALC3]
MPIIQINILEGRSDELKQRLIVEVTDAVSRTLGNSPDSIRVLLYEVPKSHWAVGGKSMAEHGEAEQAGEAERAGEAESTGKVPRAGQTEQAASMDMERAVSVDGPGPDM